MLDFTFLCKNVEIAIINTHCCIVVAPLPSCTGPFREKLEFTENKGLQF